jgi:hypothetical protein
MVVGLYATLSGSAVIMRCFRGRCPPATISCPCGVIFGRGVEEIEGLVLVLLTKRYSAGELRNWGRKAT